MKPHEENALDIMIDLAMKKHGEIMPILQSGDFAKGFQHLDYMNCYVLYFNLHCGTTTVVACCDKTLLPLNDKFRIDYETVCKGVRNEQQPVGV